MVKVKRNTDQHFVPSTRVKQVTKIKQGEKKKKKKETPQKRALHVMKVPLFPQMHMQKRAIVLDLVS